MTRGRIRRAVSWLLIVTMNVYPVQGVFAQDLPTVGRASQSLGKTLVEDYNAATPQYDTATQTMTIPTSQSGAGTTTISVNELFPGTSGAPDQPMSRFFPDAAIPDIDELQGVSSDGQNLDTTGRNFQSSLYDDANSEEPSTTGAAYKVMMDMANRSRPDMTDDPVFDLTKNVYANIDTISAEFGDCTTKTSYTDIENSYHIPEYKTCERVLDKSNNCEVIHQYDAGIIKHHSGPFNILPLDHDSLNIWIGDVGDDYWTGACTIYEQFNEFVVLNPAAIRKVSITYAKWDDHMQIYIGKSGEELLVWSGPGTDFPPETAGECELGTSWETAPGVDITHAFLNAIDEGDIVRFKIRVSVSGSGEGYARLQIDYDPALAVLEDTWQPQECIDAAKGLYDGKASGSVTCTQISPEAETNGCIMMNAIEVCNADLQAAPFNPLPGVVDPIPALCERVQVEAQYDFFKGEYCFTAADGTQECVESGDGARDTCTVYEDDPTCGFISQQCVKGSEAPDGTCYLFEEVWDCGTDVPINDVESDVEYVCAGPIRCMGADCLDPEHTQSTSFAQTSALLNAAQFMTQDMNCLEPDINQNVTCSVFSGQPHECKIAVGGVQDCCDVPTNTSPATYIAAMFQVAKLDSGLMSLQDGAIKGTYQTLKDPIVNTVSKVTKPFASYAENMSGSVTEFFEPVTVFVDDLKKQIAEAIVNTMNDMLGQTATHMGADAATAAATEGFAQQAARSAGETIVTNVAAAASAVMLAYTTYVVAVMVVQTLYKCEEDEFALAARKDTRSCTYVGSYCASDILGGCIEKRESYCCFNSPLSRLINEQIRPQLARPFGDPEYPDCEGIDMSEVANVDWSRVDLTEWTAMLTHYDLMPQVNALTMESLTGMGSDLNAINGNRPDVLERTEQRLDGLDIDAARREAADNTAVDPSGR